jgi:hypothetical protein
MGLVGAVTLMLLHDRFVATPDRAVPLKPSRVVMDGVVLATQAPAAIYEAL